MELTLFEIRLKGFWSVDILSLEFGDSWYWSVFYIDKSGMIELFGITIWVLYDWKTK